MMRLKDLDYTLDAAKENMGIGLYVVAAFYLHLAVEKALKATIISLKNKTPAKTHRLQRLYSEIADKVLLTEKQVEFLEELTPVATKARYADIEFVAPSEIYTKELVQEYMEKALPIIKKLKTCIQEK